MLPGVGVFGTGSTARVLVPLLRGEGFEVRALWGRSEEEARSLAQELGIPFHTSQSDDVLLHPDVDLVCIYISPPLTRQIAVKALGKTTQMHACTLVHTHTHSWVLCCPAPPRKCGRLGLFPAPAPWESVGNHSNNPSVYTTNIGTMPTQHSANTQNTLTVLS